jgi:hypothetical protein
MVEPRRSSDLKHVRLSIIISRAWSSSPLLISITHNTNCKSAHKQAVSFTIIFPSHARESRPAALPFTTRYSRQLLLGIRTAREASTPAVTYIAHLFLVLSNGGSSVWRGAEVLGGALGPHGGDYHSLMT